jgi:hypothetical protein
MQSRRVHEYYYESLTSAYMSDLGYFVNQLPNVNTMTHSRLVPRIMWGSPNCTRPSRKLLCNFIYWLIGAPHNEESVLTTSTPRPRFEQGLRRVLVRASTTKNISTTPPKYGTFLPGLSLVQTLWLLKNSYVWPNGAELAGCHASNSFNLKLLGMQRKT